MQELPLIARARVHTGRVAIATTLDYHSYQDLLDRSALVASALLGDRDDLLEERVALIAPAGFDDAALQWGIWRAGGVVVALGMSATEPELRHALRDSGATRVLTVPERREDLQRTCEPMELRCETISDLATAMPRPLPQIAGDRRAMLLYTSGTTSSPKGVVTTHDNIRAQVESLVEAWRWGPTDRAPLFLPMHHIHGVVNILACALWSGATLEPFERFDAATILRRVSDGAYTVFMAVPTIYVKLIAALEALPPPARAAATKGFAAMRLMVSGSAALPATVFAAWEKLTGQRLLERYGMTEIGMALSNPYSGERRPGSVGMPLPGVEVRLKAESGEFVEGEDLPGEIQVRGPVVFKEYWNRTDATTASFDDGWFRTGDIAVKERGYYRILGRQSVDIIKSGGYKLSALEIEAALLDHPSIAECAVIGVGDDTWGEAVAAAVVLRGSASMSIDDLKAWSRERLSTYKIPKRLRVVDHLPRNAMGKVSKTAVKDLFR